MHDEAVHFSRQSQVPTGRRIEYPVILPETSVQCFSQALRVNPGNRIVKVKLHECSSAVNNVSADSLLAGSINFYCYIVVCVLTVVWLAALTLNVYSLNKILKTKYKSSTAPFHFETCYCFYTALSWIKLF